MTIRITNPDDAVTKGGAYDPTDLTLMQQMANSPPQSAALDIDDGRVFGHEAKTSRTISGDLERETITHVYTFRGSPDDVRFKQAVVKALEPGHQHPWWPNMYATHYKIDHVSHGLNSQAVNVPSEAHAWSRVIVTYVQRPCPDKFEEEMDQVLVSRPNWFSIPEADTGGPDVALPKLLTGSQQSMSLLEPMTILVRRYIRKALGRDRESFIRRQLSHTNGREFKDEDPGYWLFERFQKRHLWGDPDDGSATYNITLTFRGDPRNHKLWWPKVDANSHAIVNPSTVNYPPGSTAFDKWSFLHEKRKLYPSSDVDWDDLIPGIPATCNADDQPNPQGNGSG